MTTSIVYRKLLRRYTSIFCCVHSGEDLTRCLTLSLYSFTLPKFHLPSLLHLNRANRPEEMMVAARPPLWPGLWPVRATLPALPQPHALSCPAPPRPALLCHLC